VISATQAAQYLDQAAGVTLPPFLIAAAVETIEEAEPAMVDAGYTEATQVQIQCMAVALVAARGAPRQIASQGAASGASRSFRYAEGAMSALRRSLRALDTAGTVTALVGPDPAGGTLFMVVP
jgi:hypothetical protein